MEFRQLTNHIFYSTHEERRDRPVLGYVTGKCFSLMIDAGASPHHLQWFYRHLTERKLRLPQWTIITHWHWDHSFGMVAACGITVAHKNTGPHLQRLKNWEWSDKALTERFRTGEDIEFGQEAMNAEYGDLTTIRIAEPHLLYEGCLQFDLGDLHCQVLELPSPHSDDSSLIWIPQDRVIFIDDATCPDFYDYNRYNPTKLQAMTDLLSSLEFDTCFIGHWIPLSKEELICYLGDLCAKYC